MNGREFLACREGSFRTMYIYDSIIAAVIHLDRDCVPLLPTLGPLGRLDSCGLGVPGAWLSLEHRLREIDENVRSIGMKINAKKTTLTVFTS